MKNPPPSVKLKQKMEELKSRIKKAEQYKEEIISTVQKLVLSLRGRKITYTEYHEKLNTFFNNKSPESWIEYYNNQIELCRHQLQNCEKEIKKETRKALIKKASPFIVILCVLILLLISIIKFLETPILLAPAGPAQPGGIVDLRAQTCAEQNNQGIQNSFSESCEGVYPNSCSLSGDRLSCLDRISETAINSKSGTVSAYGGVRIESFNNLIVNCDIIDQVILYYKFWCSSQKCKIGQHVCTVGVDANGGASWTNSIIACSNTEPSGILSLDVTNSEAWSCSNFFTPSGERAIAKAQAQKIGGTGSDNWNFDALYFQVFYSDLTLPSITISSIGGDSLSPYSINDNTPEAIITTNENADCRASLLDESYADMANDIDCTGDGTTSHTCQFIAPIPDSVSQEMHFACRDIAGNENSQLNNLDTTVEIDTLPPLQSAHNPPLSSTINTNSQTITFITNEIGDCRASLLDESYADMANDIDCTGDGTTSHSCSISGLSPGPVTIYIACQDDTEVSPNQDTIATNQHIDYTVDATLLQGWPVTLPDVGYHTWSSPAVADIDNDGILEVIITDTDDTANSFLHVLNSVGSPKTGFPVAGGHDESSPAVANIVGDPNLEIFVGYDSPSWLVAYSSDGTAVPGFPPISASSENHNHGTPTLIDIDAPNADGIEILIPGHLISNFWVFTPTGADKTGWPQPTRGIQAVSAAVANVDADPEMEIFAALFDGIYGYNYDGTLLSGWPVFYPANTDVWSLPALGDIDGDGAVEFMIHLKTETGASETSRVFAYNTDGTDVTGFPVTIVPVGNPTIDSNDLIMSSVALGDVNGDGIPEIIVGGFNGQVHVINGLGSSLPGWPQTTGSQVVSSAVIADIDGDADMEIIIGANDERLYAWHHDGTSVSGFPKLLDGKIKSSPSIADLNSNGFTDIIVATENKVLYAFSTTGSYSPSNIEWATLQHDFQRTGLYQAPNIPPTITSIDTSFSPLTLSAGTTKDVVFQFTAEDLDGASDLNDATATATFSRAGETDRMDPLCTFILETLPNQRTYQCTITMQYYDDDGLWDITASIQDNSGTQGQGTETFTVNLLQDISISPALINFPTLVQGSTNIQSLANTQITNNGNFNTPTDGFVSIIASNLVGETNPAEFIPASNFKAVGSSQAGTVCLSGTSLAHATATQIPSISLPRGQAGSNIETITYCLTQVPGVISPQFYSATQTAGSPWTITLLAAPLLIRRKKKKQAIDKNNLLSILDEKLKDNYNITLNELLTTVKKIKEEKEILTIPISIFNQKISPAESLCKYLKENKNLAYSQISKLINRNQRTLWINYRNARRKNKDKFKISKEKQIQIPVDIFSDRRLSILESLILHLKEKGMKNSEISKMLNKDIRNVWTFYSRAMIKLKRKN